MDEIPEPRLPYWPAALNKKMAAAYCGLSSETFDKVCPVRPVSFTGSVRGQRYLRQRLDEWLVSIDPNGAPATRTKHSLSRQWEETSRSSWVNLDASDSYPSTGADGYPIVDDKSNPLKQWYDKLGFDPRTMGEADMKRLMAENDARWKSAIPGTKIGKREQSALEKLVGIGIGVRVWSHDVKGCGGDTTDRLEARGFIGREQMLPPEKVAEGYTREEIWLLQAGLDAALSFNDKNLKRDR